MTLPKSVAVLLFASATLSASSTFAATNTDEQQEAIQMPALTIMAEREMRAETGIVEYQEQVDRRKALQHRVMELERDTQNKGVDATIVSNMDILPAAAMPDMSNLSPLMQQHVLDIAAGLQSSDPRNGLYIMLQPFGIDRNATSVQISRDQINMGTIDRQLNINPKTSP
ncbi:hypothetical protein F7P75_04290 [Acinetobacter gandensis]|uniref:Uncharacterized protein n=2 Tax=Moraxellaceae TaxID=468 RepID=A0A1A7RFJ3_9GAMM|nr:hypothetical protein F7P75_04290 [Acinetobacter gandensis]OBX30203.1 hypothetical protein A9J31_00515 [Acinetobacter gandensis]